MPNWCFNHLHLTGPPPRKRLERRSTLTGLPTTPARPPGEFCLGSGVVRGGRSASSSAGARLLLSLPLSSVFLASPAAASVTLTRSGLGQPPGPRPA